MSVEKFSVSFDLELGQAVRTSAARRRQSVSAWLAESARDRLRLELLSAAVVAWEEEHGPLGENELAEAERILDAPAKH